MQAVALHVLQHSKAEVSATPFSPAENVDFTSGHSVSSQDTTV